MTNSKRLIHLAGSALAIIAIVYFGHTMAHYWTQSAGAIWHPIVALAVVCCILLGVIGYFLSAASWVQICRALGLDLRHAMAFRIYFISQFGKYLPGNVAQHAGRLAMGMREKLPGTAVATSQLVEILMVIGSLSIIALTLGSSYLIQWQPDLARIKAWYIGLAIVILGLAVVLGLRLLRRSVRLAYFSELMHRLVASQQGISHLVSATLLIVANAATTTAGLYLITSAVSGSHAVSPLGICCIFIVSWLAGFVTPGSPAGLGVRETVMLTLLSQTIPMSDAVATSIVFRVATTMTDLSVFCLGLGLSPKRQSRIATR